MAMQTRTFQHVALQQHQPSAFGNQTSIKLHINRRARQLHAAAARDWQAPAVAAAAVQRRQHIPRLQPSRLQQQPAWICRTSIASQATPEPIPDDVNLELNPDTTAKEVLYDEATKTVRIPLAAVTDGQRRTKMVMFTCNKCGGRSARLVNPVAWARGAVFCQCQHCAVWHMLKADKSIVEEIRYNDPDWQLPEAKQGAAATAAAATAAALAASGGVAELVSEDSQQSATTGLALGPAAAAAAAADGSNEEEVTSQQQ